MVESISVCCFFPALAPRHHSPPGTSSESSASFFSLTFEPRFKATTASLTHFPKASKDPLLFGLLDNDGGVYRLEYEIGDKHQHPPISFDRDQIARPKALGHADKEVKAADYHVTMAQPIKQLIQMGAMGLKDVFTANQAPNKGEGRVIDKVEQ